MNSGYYAISALGECLVDIIVEADEKSGSLIMNGNPGGAPLNVLAAAARLGVSTAFIGKLSRDSFGVFLLNTIKASNISADGVVITDKYPTTLAVVTLDQQGDRGFSFYRKETSDIMIESSEIDFDVIRNSRIFHFGSVSMTAEPSRNATFAAAKYAKDHSKIVSYDPNLRERLWGNLDEARTVILQGMDFANIVKVSDEELCFLSEMSDLYQAACYLVNAYNIDLLAVTAGSKGAHIFTKGKQYGSPAYHVDAIDTTGAGDAFWGAFLSCLIKSGKQVCALEDYEITEFLKFANAAGAIVTTRKGAIPAMPTNEEIAKIMH